MSKIGTLVETYREDGLKSSANEIKRFFLSGSGAKYTKSALGKRYHQKLYMYDRLGYWPKIKNPRTFNEKILHRKLYTNNELFSIVGDKWKVRNYVSGKLDEDILPEVYHVTDDPTTIPFDELPDDYVIKPTHMSGPIIFIDENEKPNRSSIQQSCYDWLNTTYGSIKEEYWYSKIKPQIIIEELLKDKKNEYPPDFKFFVFHGKVEYIEVDTDRHTNHKRRFYDRNWNAQEFELKFPLGPVIDKPNSLDKMINIAEKLGSGFDFIRVDLYELNGERIVFGELTVGPESGGGQFRPLKYDFEFSSYW